MADDAFASEDFDKLLDDFISSQLQDTEDTLAELNETRAPAENTVSSDETNPETTENYAAETDDGTESLTDIFNQINDEETSLLAMEEKRLFDAYRNLISAVNACGEAAEIKLPKYKFSAEELLPRFRPNRIDNLNHDIVKAWEVLIAAQPIRLTSLPANASDEQILNFAEKTTDNNLQMALVSYVETLIEIDACEVAYNLRKIKYQKHKIEKKIYEEQQQRREKMRKYIKAIKDKNFPIDAEMLVNNFFKTVRKDPDGAQKILENNPATFAPILFEKIKARFFGMIKPKPEDGIKINKKLGKFLKKLKA